MSAFDPTDKKSKIYLDYFENKTWLVVDSSASTRTSIKKSIAQVGSKLSLMIDADNLADAQHIIKTKKPHYVIGSNSIGGGSSVALFESHLSACPNRLNAGFFIICDPSIMTEVAMSMEFDMDGIVALPFTGSSIIETIIQSAKDKISPSTYLNKFEEGRASFLSGNLERAMESFQTAITLSKHPYESFFYLGQIYRMNELEEKAISFYEEAVYHNTNYYKPLSRLRSLYYTKKLYKKAYDVNLVMVQKYPTPPERIPELIRLSIINKKYEDINNYLTIYRKVQTPDVETQTYLSAGLAVLGKYFINLHDLDKGIDALKGSFRFSNGKYEILKSISQTFEDCHKLDILFSMFEETDLDLWPQNAQGIYFHAFHLTSEDDQRVISTGELLLKKKVKDVYIYKGLIERSIKTKRASGSLERLVLEATRDFPEYKTEFEEMLLKAHL